MHRRLIKRTRVYFAVEGNSEQSFVRLLQSFVDQRSLNIVLDSQVLYGGGYKIMLERAKQYRSSSQKKKIKAEKSILIVDADRDQKNEDSWGLDQLKQNANKIDFHVFAQDPNIEGLFFRMFPGNENKKVNSVDANTNLRRFWPKYEKGADFRTLSSKFCFNDLLRVSKIDEEVSNLLSLIGLI